MIEQSKLAENAMVSFNMNAGRYLRFSNGWSTFAKEII